MLLGAHVSKTAGSLDLQRDRPRVAGVDDAVNLLPRRRLPASADDRPVSTSCLAP